MIDFNQISRLSPEQIQHTFDVCHNNSATLLADLNNDKKILSLMGLKNPPKVAIGSNVVARREVALGYATALNDVLEKNPNMQAIALRIRDREWATDIVSPYLDQLKIKKYLRSVSKLKLDGLAVTGLIPGTDGNDDPALEAIATILLWGTGLHNRMDEIRIRLGAGLKRLPQGKNILCLKIDSPSAMTATLCTAFNMAFACDPKKPNKMQALSKTELRVHWRIMSMLAVTSLKSLTVGWNDGQAILRGAFASCDARLRANKDKPDIHRDCIAYEVARMGREISKKFELPRVISR